MRITADRRHAALVDIKAFRTGKRMQAKPAAESFLLALQHCCLKKTSSHGAKALRLSQRRHQFLNVPGRRFDVIDVDQRLPLLLRKSAGVRHGLDFHDALQRALVGEAIKLDCQQLQFGFLPGPVPVEVPRNQESLVRLLRQGPCCRQDDGPPLRLRFDEMVRLDLQYVRTWSPWLDLKILFKTPVAVIRGGDAF